MKRIIVLLVLTTLILSVACLGEIIDYDVVEQDPFDAEDVVGHHYLRNPEQPITAGELITAVSRLHSYADGKFVSTSLSSEQLYKEYALKNGLAFEGQFDDMQSSATKADIAYVLGRSLENSELAAINKVFSLPDCDVNATYYPYAVKLVNAGILECVNEYGAFNPTGTIPRYALVTIINRVLYENTRVKKNYIAYASDEPFFLIDDFLMGDSTTIGGRYTPASGWRYDYTGAASVANVVPNSSEDIENTYVNTLRDLSETDNMTMWRDVQPQKDGKLVLETSFNISFGFEGIKFIFSDIDGKSLFEMGTNETGLYFTDGGEIAFVEVAAPTSGSFKGNRAYNLMAYPSSSAGTNKERHQIRARITFDLDEGTASVVISGKEYGTYKLEPEYNGFSRVTFSTGIEEVVSCTFKQVHLYKNYAVFDNFRTDKVNSVPYGYTSYGNNSVISHNSIASNQGDYYSLRIRNYYNEEHSYVSRSFDEVEGKVRFEAFLLNQSDVDTMYFSVGVAGNEILRVGTFEEYIYIQDADGNNLDTIRVYDCSVWQKFEIVADTNTQTATFKINGKVLRENVPFLKKTNKFDWLEIGVYGQSYDYIYVDDVHVYEVFDEFDDYVPEPVPLDTGDYILSMSICNLWRNGSHYGWDTIAAHPETEPITGYYDEGIAEAMDWEIKFLVEHGVTTYNMCWYSPNVPSVPMRKPRMTDALHDGYFNSKYADYLNISLMWENNNYTSTNSATKFKNYIFPFWMEWYFSDDRYLRIQEDGKEYLLLNVYNWKYFRNMCRTSNDMSDADAQKEANALIQWMSQQVADAGYADGLIVTFSHSGYADPAENANEAIASMGGEGTAIYPYAWGRTSYNLNTQKTIIENFYKEAQKSGIDLLALAAVGFNDVAWATTRYPLMSDADFEELLRYLKDDYMPRYADDEDSWKQRFIQFDTWNEYGEGHYIYPTVGLEPQKDELFYEDGYGGYGYLEAIAKVFGTNYDAQLHEQLDVYPTDAQKERLGHIYLDNNSIIRRNFLPGSMNDDIVPSVLKSFGAMASNNVASKFITSAYGVKSYPTASGLKPFKYDSVENAILVTSTNNDPQLVMSTGETQKTNADDCDILHIRSKSTLSDTAFQIFFVTDENSNQSFNEDCSFKVDFKPANKWNDYYIDLRTNKNFKGNLVKLRLDLGDLSGNDIYVSHFEFLSFADEQKRTQIFIDGVKYTTVDYWEIQEESRHEIYIAPSDANHFYRMMHIVYIWEREKGILYLDTPNGTTFKFTVGSDMVVVNGDRQETLLKPLWVYDGAPVLPLIYIMDTAGYNYSNDYTGKKLTISSKNKTEWLDIPGAKANSDDTTFYTKDTSTLTRVADSQNSQNYVWRSSSWSFNTENAIYADVSLSAGTEYVVEFDAMGDYRNVDGWGVNSYDIYLVTTDVNGAQERLKANSFTMYGDETWHHFTCEITPDKDIETISVMLAAVREYNSVLYLDNISIRNEPHPFVLLNADAEDDDMSMWYTHSPNTVARVNDGTGNHIIDVKYGVNGTKWLNLIQKVKYEPGVTYYYKFDIKIGENTAGDNSSPNVVVNPQYYDLFRQSLTYNKNDHTLDHGVVNKNDGWTTINGSFTVSMGYVPVEQSGVNEEFAIFTNPTSSGTVAHDFQIDNIVISTSPIDD